MHAHVAQLVSLVAYGNSFLTGRELSEEPEQNLSAFRFVDSVTFELPDGAEGRQAVSGVDEWFTWLRAARVSRLWLAHGRPRFFDVWNPGLSIRAELPAGKFGWEAEWHVAAGAGKDQTWEVEYRTSRVARWRRIRTPSGIQEAEKAIRRAVERALALSAADERYELYVGVFGRALELLDEDNPPIPIYPDLVPDGVEPVHARRLLACATQAWVLGGMGSWLDMPPHVAGRRAYKRVTRELDVALTKAVVAATNALVPPV